MTKCCSRCGVELARLNVTSFSDQEPVYVYIACDCPGPRCPFCGRRVDDRGRCPSDVECFLGGHLVPLPEIA